MRFPSQRLSFIAPTAILVAVASSCRMAEPPSVPGPASVQGALADRGEQPEQAAGAAVNGLKVTIRVENPDLRVGDELKITATLRNVSDRPIALLWPTDYRARLLTITDARGQVVPWRMTAITEGWMSDKPFDPMEPGATITTAFTGRLAFQVLADKPDYRPRPTLTADFRDDATLFSLGDAGMFGVSLNLTVEGQVAVQIARASGAPAWTGALASNMVRFQVTPASRDQLDAAIRSVSVAVGAAQREAIELVKAHADIQAAPALAELLLNGPAGLRAEASAALCAIRDPGVVPRILARYRRTDSPQFRQSLLSVIESASDWTRLHPLYVEIARSNFPWDERARAVSRLVDLRRPEAAPILIGLAGGNDPIERRFAIDLMGSLAETPGALPEPEVIRVIETLVAIVRSDDDGPMRGRAAGALRLCRRPAAVLALVDGLKDQSGARVHALNALEQFGRPDAIAPLERLIADAPDQATLDAASAALRAIRQRAMAETISPTTQPDGRRGAWMWDADGRTRRAAPDGMRRVADSGLIEGFDDIAAIECSSNGGFLLRADGTVWAWGHNGDGRLGDGTKEDRTTPVRVKGLTDVTAIAAKWAHGLALKRDGTVWAWGNNHRGQLGDGTTENRPEPVQVKDLVDVVAVAAGAGFSAVLRKDGTVWGWRRGLGDDRRSLSGLPVRIEGVDEVVAISAGLDQLLALRKDGTVWSAGLDYWQDYSFHRIEGLRDVKAVAAGWWFFLALNADGTVWTWGDLRQAWRGTDPETIVGPLKRIAPADDSQPGVPRAERESRRTVYRVLDWQDVEAIDAECRGIVLRRDGSVWEWGWDCPLRRVDLPGRVLAVRTGWNHSMALLALDEPRAPDLAPPDR